ncbi:MAG TPA: HupE/UreJ family protein [Candidatus Eisenbacteria bacterium]|nr:HupE/UreJ family protein [Candidatus Eisenbacteria bacterium]
MKKLAFFLLLTLAGPASAHDQPYSYLDLRLGAGVVEGRVAAHVIDIAHESGLDADSLREPAYLARVQARIERVFLERVDVSIAGQKLAVRPTGLAPVPDRKLVALDFTAPMRAGKMVARGPLFAYDPAHETYLNVFVAGTLRVQDLLTCDHHESVCDVAAGVSVREVVARFIVQGVKHIFQGPDHIAFVVGLLLLGGGMRRLLKIVTAFTAAHSITLAVATLGVFQPPSRIVEPAIAASIVCIGIENLRHRAGMRDRRALLAFCFGLVHGFGFASVLRETGLPAGALGWSLASFNLGVEMGQTAIVLSLAPALAWVHSASLRASWRVAFAGSWVIVCAGGYWFAERLLAR